MPQATAKCEDAAQQKQLGARTSHFIREPVSFLGLEGMSNVFETGDEDRQDVPWLEFRRSTTIIDGGQQDIFEVVAHNAPDR